MKKLLFIALISVSLLTCKKDEPPAPTTYVLTNSTSILGSSLDYINGTIWETIIFCYDDKGDVVREDICGDVSPGGCSTAPKELTDNIVKLVVSFKVASPKSPAYSLPSNNRKYTIIKFAIKPQTINRIELTDKTMVTTTPPF